MVLPESFFCTDKAERDTQFIEHTVQVTMVWRNTMKLDGGREGRMRKKKCLQASAQCIVDLLATVSCLLPPDFSCRF